MAWTDSEKRTRRLQEDIVHLAQSMVRFREKDQGDYRRI